MAACALATACETVTVSPVPAARIDVEPRAVDLIPGRAQQLQAVVRDASGAPLTGRPVAWESSDPRIATVDAGGMVWAVGPGTSAITARSGPASATAAVLVSPAGRIELSRRQAAFTAALGHHDPPPLEIAVADGASVGLRELSVTVRYDPGAGSGWLGAALAGNTAPTVLSLRVSAAGLGLGRYRAVAELRDPRAGNSPDSVLVTLDVIEPRPSIVVEPDSLVFSTEGVLSTDLRVTSAGVGTLSGLATSVTYEPGGPRGWLAVTQTGTVAPVTIRANIVPDGLGAGTYRAGVEVSSTVEGVAPVTIPVVLAVAPPAPRLSLEPGDLRLVAATGAGTVSDSVRVENQGVGVVASVAAAVSYGAGQPTGWLQATLAGTSTPTVLWLDASPASLPPGTYDASVEVTGLATNSPQFLTVAFTVTPAGTVIPAAPTGLTGIPQSADTALLDWVDMSDNEDEFRIERSDDLGATWSRIATIPADSTGHLDSGLAGGATYHYRVQACNVAGCSVHSPVAVLTMPVVASSPPKAPDGLTATAVSAIDVDLDWNDNSDDETHFELEGRLAGGQWVQIALLPTGTVHERVTGLTPGTQYEFRVRACNPAGCSKWSNRKKVTMPDPSTVPAAPSGLAATSITQSSVDLVWTDNSNDETAMVVQRSDGVLGAWHTVAVLPVNTASWTDGGVISGMDYYYRAGACNPVGCSAASNVITVRTP